MWERRVADKALAYNLLHSDYIVKMHDLDQVRCVFKLFWPWLEEVENMIFLAVTVLADQYNCLVPTATITPS